MQTAVDACPGMLSLHTARDGDVARIRLPGGYVTRRQWTAIAALAREFGDGNVDITSRGNVQVRGLTEKAAAGLVRRAARAGLLPSGSHDRARNITASPLAGLGNRPPLRRLVKALDAAIVADPLLAALPGRFVFAVDDGTGGAALSRCDIGLRRTGRHAELIIAGRTTGSVLPVRAAVPAAITAARAAVALGVGSTTARIRDLPGGADAVVTSLGGAACGGSDGVAASLGGAACGGAVRSSASLGGAVGPAAPSDDSRLALGPIRLAGRDVLIAGARLSRLSAAQVGLTGSLLHRADVLRLAAAGRVVIPLAVTPSDAAARLAGSGLLTSDEDVMSGVSACSGMACSRSAADVRTLGAPLPGHPRTHWVGCARGCGAPFDADLVVATGPDSFEVGGRPVDIAVARAS